MMDFLDFFTSISKHGLKDPASHTSGAIFSYEWIISDFGISELLQIVVDFIRNPSMRKWHQSEKDFRNCQGLFSSFFTCQKTYPSRKGCLAKRATHLPNPIVVYRFVRAKKNQNTLLGFSNFSKILKFFFPFNRRNYLLYWF